MSEIRIYKDKLRYKGEVHTVDPRNHFDGMDMTKIVSCVLDEVSRVTPFKVLDSRDGGWDGNRIFKLENQETGEVFECRGYHSLMGAITINTTSIVEQKEK